MTKEEFIQHFGDCPEAHGQLGGIFEGKALAEVEHVDQKMTPQGPRLTFRCQWCGRSHQMVCSWDDMVFIANRTAPPGWDYNAEERRLAPKGVFCQGCGEWELKPLFTADEAKTNLKAAIEQGWYPPQRAQQIAAQIAQQRQQQGR